MLVAFALTVVLTTLVLASNRVGLHAVIWSFLFIPYLAGPKVGLLPFPAAYAPEVALLVLGAKTLATYALRHTRSHWHGVRLGVAVALGIASVVAILPGGQSSAGQYALSLKDYLLPLIFFFCVQILAGDLNAKAELLHSFLIAILTQVPITIIQRVTWTPASLFDFLDASGGTFSRFGTARPLGAILSLLLVVLWVGWRTGTVSKQRFINYVSILLIPLVLGISRGSIIGVVAAIVLAEWLVLRTISATRVVMAAAFGIATLVAISRIFPGSPVGATFASPQKFVAEQLSPKGAGTAKKIYLGKIAGLAYSLQTLSAEPARLVVGYGLGSAKESKTLGVGNRTAQSLTDLGVSAQYAFAVIDFGIAGTFAYALGIIALFAGLARKGRTGPWFRGAQISTRVWVVWGLLYTLNGFYFDVWKDMPVGMFVFLNVSWAFSSQEPPLALDAPS